MGIEALKYGLGDTPIIDVTEQPTTAPTASPFFKYAAIGLGGLGVLGLIWFLAKRKHSERAVYQNPERYKVDYAEKVFTDFHGFEPTKLKEVSVPDEYPDELVLIGKADEVLYRSNKINGAPNKDGKEKSYVHDFKNGAIWATDKEGKGLYLINPDLQVKPEGLVH